MLLLPLFRLWLLRRFDRQLRHGFRFSSEGAPSVLEGSGVTDVAFGDEPLGVEFEGRIGAGFAFGEHAEAAIVAVGERAPKETGLNGAQLRHLFDVFLCYRGDLALFLGDRTSLRPDMNFYSETWDI